MGGEAGGSFSDLVAAYSLQAPSSVVQPPSLPFSISHPLCVLNIDRRICTARNRPPIETLTSLSSVEVAMHIVYLHRR